MEGTQERKKKKSKGGNQKQVRQQQSMNRKERRELARKTQADDVSLEVIHPDAVGIDIGNETLCSSTAET